MFYRRLNENIEIVPIPGREAEERRKKFICLITNLYFILEIISCLTVLICCKAYKSDAQLKTWICCFIFRWIGLFHFIYSTIVRQSTDAALAAFNIYTMATLLIIHIVGIYFLCSAAQYYTPIWILCLCLELIFIVAVSISIISIVLNLIVLTLSCIIYSILYCGGYISRQQRNAQQRSEHSMDAELEQLGTYEYRGENPICCAICLEDISYGNSIRILPCAHMFHVQCIDQWLRVKPTCCHCRSNPWTIPVELMRSEQINNGIGMQSLEVPLLDEEEEEEQNEIQEHIVPNYGFEQEPSGIIFWHGSSPQIEVASASLPNHIV